MLSEEYFESVQFLGNALDVVKPIDTDDDLALFKALLKLVQALLDAGEFDTFHKLPGVDADGERAHLNPASFELDAVGLGFKTKDACTRAQEVTSVVVCVETDVRRNVTLMSLPDEVALKHTKQDFTSDWEDSGRCQNANLVPKPILTGKSRWKGTECARRSRCAPLLCPCDGPGSLASGKRSWS